MAENKEAEKRFFVNSIEHLNTQMYRENEIAKARLALLNNTNMVEYAMDEFKKIHKTEDVPEGKSR